MWQIGRGQTTDQILGYSALSKNGPQRTVNHVMGLSPSGHGGAKRSSRRECSPPSGPPRSSVQLGYRLVRRVRIKLLWIEGPSLLEDRVDNPPEFLGDDRNRLRFAVP